MVGIFPGLNFQVKAVTDGGHVLFPCIFGSCSANKSSDYLSDHVMLINVSYLLDWNVHLNALFNVRIDKQSVSLNQSGQDQE